MLDVRTEMRKRIAGKVGRRSRSIRQIVVHGMECGCPGNYVIRENGSVVHALPDDEFSLLWSDELTLDIIVEERGRGNSHGFTSRQYNAAMKLIMDKLAEHPTVTIVTSHGMNRRFLGGEYVRCPANFDWTHLKNELLFQDYQFNFQQERVTNIDTGSY